MISVGDKIPDSPLYVLNEDGRPTPVSSLDVLGRGRVVLVGVPGAFTPTCSDTHLPSFVLRAQELRAKGVDKVACVSTNDAWVMDAWGKARQVGDTVEMLADGNGTFSEALGLTFDLSGPGLGTRSRRYAAILEDGVLTELLLEPAGGVDVSDADSVLAKL